LNAKFRAFSVKEEDGFVLAPSLSHLQTKLTTENDLGERFITFKKNHLSGLSDIGGFSCLPNAAARQNGFSYLHMYFDSLRLSFPPPQTATTFKRSDFDAYTAKFQHSQVVMDAGLDSIAFMRPRLEDRVSFDLIQKGRLSLDPVTLLEKCYKIRINHLTILGYYLLMERDNWIVVRVCII
jgi:hypothetical protein